MAEKNILTYKGHPLVRSGNDIYYGDPKGKVIVYIQILASEPRNGVQVATKCQVMVLSTDSSLPMKQRIVRISEKDSLYSAIDIGDIWLQRYANI